MTRRATDASPLAGWTVVSLRPRDQHAGLRAAAARAGARLLALSPLAVETRTDAASRHALREALAADLALFTSPNAVRAAAALQRLANARGRPLLAVGDGTRRALQRLGVDAMSPTRMDSEGLLAMPALRDIAGRRVGLVTAPGGRNRLVPSLRARGAEVRRADVYDRTPLVIAAARWRALAAVLGTPEHVVLALSSTEALDAMLRQRPAHLAQPLRPIAVSAASDRLAQAARDAGFRRIAIAADARPATLLRAAADAFV
ncbi:MAG TPA: uroporphyrinogen-III synthase [Thermomonas sp.]|nr:uroporphyrinogen-III synthase [Thermomonas sp.]